MRMLFITWLAANAAMFWVSGKMTGEGADPIGSSLLVIVMFLVLNIGFGVYAIWG